VILFSIPIFIGVVYAGWVITNSHEQSDGGNFHAYPNTSVGNITDTFGSATYCPDGFVVDETIYSTGNIEFIIKDMPTGEYQFTLSCDKSDIISSLIGYTINSTTTSTSNSVNKIEITESGTINIKYNFEKPTNGLKGTFSLSVKKINESGWEIIETGPQIVYNEKLGKVAYITSNSSVFYTSIEKALDEAVSGNIVMVIAPSKANNTLDSGLVKVDKKEYYINRDCQIKSGVSLVVPTDSSSVTQATTNLTDYIDKLKKDERDQGKYNNGGFATSYNEYYLRVTIHISSNVKLTNNGTLIISGYLSGGTGSGSIAGQTSHSYSKFILEENANIIQSSSSANIYCFGYIEESENNNNSSIKIEKGNIYIPFIIKDAPEFWSTLALADNGISSYKIPPFNQFEFRNIEPQLTIEYNGFLIAMENLEIYAEGQIDSQNPNDVIIVGNTNSSFLKYNSQYSYSIFKYDKNTNIITSHFYGGFDVKSFSITIKPISNFSQTINMSDIVFPISWQHNVTLSRASGQTSNAAYNSRSQMIKFLPGSQLLIEDNVTVSTASMVFYSAFFDRISNDRTTNTMRFASTIYPIKDGAICRILGNSSVTSTNLAGTLYIDTTVTLDITNTSITTYEPIYIRTNNSRFLREIADVLLIKEKLQIKTISDFSKNKLFIGVNTLNSQSSCPAEYGIKLNDTLASNISNGFQTVILYDDEKKYSINLVSNINTINYYEGTTKNHYTRNLNINLSTSHYVDILSSHLSISNNNDSINEFEIQSMTLTAFSSPEEIDGVMKQVVLIDQKELLTANIVDYDKVYEKVVTFTTPDPSILSITSVKNNTCEIMGKSEGTATITATCDDATCKLEIVVVKTLANLTPISANDSYIAYDTKHFNSQTMHTHQYGNNKNCSSTPDVTASNTSDTPKYLSFTLNILPINSDIESIVWSWSGDTSYVQLVDSSRIKVNKLTGATTVEVWVGNTGSNGNADSSCLACTITDKLSNEVTYYICIRSSADAYCITSDTLITMSNGTSEKVQNINIGDLVKTWDFETGTFSIKPVIYIEKSEPMLYQRINVEFDDGTFFGIIGQHTLFDMNARNYFVIEVSTINKSIGKTVMAIDDNGNLSSKVITNIDVYEEYGSVYEIVTAYDMNFISNGVVSAEGMIIKQTFFDLDENYKYDQELKEKDIESYGLFTYEEFSDVLTLEQFELLNGKYFKVGLGKGYYSLDFIYYMINRFKTTGGTE